MILTSGVVDRSPISDTESEQNNSPLVSMPTIPAVYLMNDSQTLEKFGDIDMVVETEEVNCRKTSNESNGDKYLTIRRHTVGPGDTSHEQVSEDRPLVKIHSPLQTHKICTLICNCAIF